jgi:hypothetical protein
VTIIPRPLEVPGADLAEVYPSVRAKDTDVAEALKTHSTSAPRRTTAQMVPAAYLKVHTSPLVTQTDRSIMIQHVTDSCRQLFLRTLGGSPPLLTDDPPGQFRPTSAFQVVHNRGPW